MSLTTNGDVSGYDATAVLAARIFQTWFAPRVDLEEILMGVHLTNERNRNLFAMCYESAAASVKANQARRWYGEGTRP